MSRTVCDKPPLRLFLEHSRKLQRERGQTQQAGTGPEPGRSAHLPLLHGKADKVLRQRPLQQQHFPRFPLIPQSGVGFLLLRF